MIDPAWIALGGSIGGGLFLQTIEHYMSKPRESDMPFDDMFVYVPPTKVEIMRAILNSYNKARQTPREAMAIVARIGRLSQEIWPLLPRLGEASEERYRYNAVATNYLPDALDAYNKLEPSWREDEKVFEGKTAAELLIEQLLHIERILLRIKDECVETESRDDAHALIVNALFLREKSEGY